MTIAKVGDIEMTYELHGKGKPLVLIEGFSCNRLTWKDYVPVLKEHFQVLVFDNRGSGQTSTPPGPYTIQMLARDTVELMRTLKMEKACILGHSMGSAIVQQICLDFPQAIEKGMLCASFTKVPEKSLMQIDVSAKLDKAGVSQELILLDVFPWLYSNAFLSRPENVDTVLKRRLGNPYPQNMTGYLAQAAAIRNFDSSAHLSRIQTPLLVVHGEEDIYTPITGAEELACNIPNAELFIFDEQAHVFNEEKASDLIAMIIEYFQR